jgi:hypothetical protein
VSRKAGSQHIIAAIAIAAIYRCYCSIAATATIEIVLWLLHCTWVTNSSHWTRTPYAVLYPGIYVLTPDSVCICGNKKAGIGRIAGDVVMMLAWTGGGAKEETEGETAGTMLA